MADIIRCAYLIRATELYLLEEFSKNRLHGTTHTCVGQEIIAAIFMTVWNEKDFVFSTHRNHGHFLARNFVRSNRKKKVEVLQKFFAEFKGMPQGVNSGRAGSQHLTSEYFMAHGVVGSMWPVSLGLSSAYYRSSSEAIVTLFTGDGAFGQGVVYETLNLAALAKHPLLVVVENNGVSQSTISKSVRSTDISTRVRAFNLPCAVVDLTSFEELYSEISKAAKFVREKKEPYILEINTDRLGPHSKLDINTSIESLREEISKEDLLQRLMEHENIFEFSIEEKIIEDSLNFEMIVNEQPINADAKYDKLQPGSFSLNVASRDLRFGNEKICHALKGCMLSNDNMIILGEDVCSPYGGAFKATEGLSNIFPGRVLNMPISESAIVGYSIGLALGKFVPWVEVMFGDFLTLCMDQILNVASKINWIANLEVPLVIRTAMGHSGGYGPSHSQSLEKHMLGISGLDVVVVNHIINLDELYKNILKNKKLTLLIENKIFYKTILPACADGFGWFVDHKDYPTSYLIPDSPRCDIILLGYGTLVTVMQQVADQLFEQFDLISYAICPTLVNHFNPALDDIFLSQMNKKPLIVCLEEGGREWGWGAEIFAKLNESGADLSVIRISPLDGFVGASKELEESKMINVEKVIDIIRNRIRVNL